MGRSASCSGYPAAVDRFRNRAILIDDDVRGPVRALVVLPDLDHQVIPGTKPVGLDLFALAVVLRRAVELASERARVIGRQIERVRAAIFLDRPTYFLELFLLRLGVFFLRRGKGMPPAPPVPPGYCPPGYCRLDIASRSLPPGYCARRAASETSRARSGRQKWRIPVDRSNKQCDGSQTRTVTMRGTPMIPQMAAVERLGESRFPSPVREWESNSERENAFIRESQYIPLHITADFEHERSGILYFEKAGPREKIYFDPTSHQGRHRHLRRPVSRSE